MLGCIEAVKFGLTCVNDLFHYASETAKTVEEVGLRAVLAHKVYDVRELGDLQHNRYDRDLEAGETRLQRNIELIENWHGQAGGRISCRIGTHAPVGELIPTLVYNMTGSEVDTVVIDGRIVVENGKIVSVNEPLIIEQARDVAENIRSQDA